MTPLPNEAIKSMVDLSTAHITEADNSIFESGNFDGFPRVVKHDYGWIIFVSSENIFATSEELRARGHSDALVNIYRKAARRRNVMLVNFDRDAVPVDGLPTFDW